MGNNLVVIEGSKVLTTSRIIAEGVGIEHRSVINLLNKHKSTKTLSTFKKTKVMTKGRPVDVAQLSELQATFLITLMKNSEIVVIFKEALVKEFFNQRRLLASVKDRQGDPDWMEQRRKGVEVHHNKSDIVARLIEYGLAQGASAGIKNHHANIAKMENAALFIMEDKYPNLRELQTINQLMHSSIDDKNVDKTLEDGMNKNLPYKDIFQNAKAKVKEFTSVVGKSPVIELLENNQPTEQT